jgi:broad specificity phosphatase PhoE
MKNEHARLHRGPFLMPIWLLGMTALAGALVMMFVGWVWLTADSTTIIVIRHAEQVQDGSKDPPLGPAGDARAQLLARLFGDAQLPGHIDAIYVSPGLRCRRTAAPLADRLGVAPSVVSGDDTRPLARRIFREHAGGRILVVRNGDTVPALVTALSGVKGIPPIGSEEYGTMYIVTVPRIGRANLLSVSY